MPFPLSLLGPRQSRIPPLSPPQVEDYDSSSSTDSTETAKSSPFATARTRPYASTSTSLLGQSPEFLVPPLASGSSARSSASSTATSTPFPSRPSSPFRHTFVTPGGSSSYNSDADSEPNSPLLGGGRRSGWWSDERRSRWWVVDPPRRLRHRRSGIRTLRKTLQKFMRHPLVPGRPTTIVLSFLLFIIFGILLGLLLKYILDPDKEPLPWRAYCAFPAPPTTHPSIAGPYTPRLNDSSVIAPSFPLAHLDTLPPAGVFLAVFSMDSALERRMFVRSTWASHSRSRSGAGEGDDGFGTSRTIVRFVLGQPRKEWQRRIRLEMDTYNDIVILPITENMNSGKTHAYFTWASESAWVPALDPDSVIPAPSFSYSNITSPAPPLAKHDPAQLRREKLAGISRLWVRPDYVIKADDDAFVMLAELEARLRLELHAAPLEAHGSTDTALSHEHSPLQSRAGAIEESHYDLIPTPDASSTLLTQLHGRASMPASPDDDPLIYWGYLVKNQFMAGELYGLSWSIVEWVARDPTVKGMIRGKEDKTTAKWMRLHPRWTEIRWSSERCWVYDHPRAGTVYSHGFLFPSEVNRLKRTLVSYLSTVPKTTTSESPLTTPTPPVPSSRSPSSWWAYSSVSNFHVRYAPPIPDLTTAQSIEALIEGSQMSKLREGGPMTADYAWMHREGRETQYEQKRLGGTVAVHFIKKNAWFLETALTLLEGEDVTQFETLSRSETQAAVSGLVDKEPESLDKDPRALWKVISAQR